jgi:hypothetical protein
VAKTGVRARDGATRTTVHTVRDPVGPLAPDLAIQQPSFGHRGDDLGEARVGPFVSDRLLEHGRRLPTGVRDSALLGKVFDNPIANALISWHTTSLKTWRAD